MEDDVLPTHSQQFVIAQLVAQQFAAGCSRPSPWLDATAVNYKGDLLMTAQMQYYLMQVLATNNFGSPAFDRARMPHPDSHTCNVMSHNFTES